MRFVLPALTATTALLVSSASSAKECVAHERTKPPTEADVENARLKAQQKQAALASAEQDAADARSQLDAAERELVADSSLQARVTAAASTLRVKLAALADAKVDADCAALESESIWTQQLLLEKGGTAVTLSASTAGGVGGTGRVGGSLMFSRSNTIAQTWDLGVGVDGLFELYPTKTNPNSDPVPTAGLRGRVNFGIRGVAFYLGFHPELVIRPNTTVAPLIAGQLGAVFRFGTNWLTSGRAFVEPRVMFDGTPVAVFFGVELGLGRRLQEEKDVTKPAFEAR